MWFRVCVGGGQKAPKECPRGIFREGLQCWYPEDLRPKLHGESTNGRPIGGTHIVFFLYIISIVFADRVRDF